MKQYINYAINKWAECYTYGSPIMVNDGKWEPFFIKMTSHEDTQAILDTMPLSVTIRTVDEEGVEIEKYTISDIDLIKDDGLYLKFRFGYTHY